MRDTEKYRDRRGGNVHFVTLIRYEFYVKRYFFGATLKIFCLFFREIENTFMKNFCLIKMM